MGVWRVFGIDAPRAAEPSSPRTQTGLDLAVDFLVFDASGVLYDDSTWRRWLFQLLQRIGMHAQYLTFYRLWEEERLEDVNAGRVEYWTAMSGYLREIGMTPAQIEEVVAAGKARMHSLDCPQWPLPGVSRTLSQLAAQGFRLAVLGNTSHPSHRLRQTLTRLGLEGRFEWIDSSATLADHGQLGRRYEAAIERCGAPAETIAYVAHCPYELRRAHESGLLTIGVGGEVGVVADAMLSGLEQLPQIIVRHTQRRQAS